MPEYTSGSSIRAERTPPRKAKQKKQIVDFRGFPLSTEEGNPLTSEKEIYVKSEYGSDNAPSVVLDSSSFQKTGVNSRNKFSKSGPAALPIEELFKEQSEVSRSLLGIDRQTTQQGLFGNVSTYGLDEKDWKVEGTSEDPAAYWYQRKSSSGPYYNTRFYEDTTNSAVALFSNPSPFTAPGKPSIQDQLLYPGGAERYRGWGQYLNSIVAQYLIEYMIKVFTPEQKTAYNLDYLLLKYPPIVLSNGSYEFNQLYWDKIWLDINQNRYGDITNYPIIPSGRAYNIFSTSTAPLVLNNFSSAALWGQGGDSRVIITEAAAVPNTMSCSWDSFFFSATRVFYPVGNEDFGHYRLQTNPMPDLWSKYFGLRWDYIRQDLKDWRFKIHASTSTITAVETDLKLPYFVLSAPLLPDKTNVFSDKWPSSAFGSAINLPTNSNRPGGSAGISTQINLKSIRSFRYQPGRISGFTYGAKVSEIGAGPGTTIEWGVENDTDSYLFRLANGANFSIIRRSIIPLENTPFLEGSGYEENTKKIVRGGITQYETTIEQKNMNGDPLGGEGKSGYILDLDTVTMYKIEFGWYGAIGARFYAYIPQKNGDCRWVVLHTLVIENQLGQPCLVDPFFYFKYRLIVGDSSTIRVNQFIYKFGASYYIDGYDKGTLYSSFAGSKRRLLSDPKFTQSKTQLNAIDWTVLMGIKPKQYLFNRFGSEIYNKKEIFPKSFSIYSQESCEIKIIRQKACPEFAYMHQEGYTWPLLPTSRRIKAKFSINPYDVLTNNLLGINQSDASTHSATMAKSGTIEGYRDPGVSANLATKASGELFRLVGPDLFGTVPAVTNNAGGFKLHRIAQGQGYISSTAPVIKTERVYLPFTYAPIFPYEGGYEIEFDYYRRDQILLSTVDITNDEFFIFWTGGGASGIDSTHVSSLRFGFVWARDEEGSPISKSKTAETWGVELPATAGTAVSYDGEKFYEGLPYDFVNTFADNALYVEGLSSVYEDTFNVERTEGDDMYYNYHLSANIGVPGSEGGVCNGLGCKAGRELRKNIEVVLIKEETAEVGVFTDVYYLKDLKTPWPSLGQSYQVTVQQGTSSSTVNVGSPITKVTEDGIKTFLLKLQNGLGTLSLGSAEVSYNIIYIATIDKKSQVKSILSAKIAPGNIPFIRVFIQARQGASLGGIWIGQKTSKGIVLDPFTPHRSTVSITDGSLLDKHGQFASTPKTDGAIKSVKAFTHIDLTGVSTAPTSNSSEGLSLDTNKSIHTSPKKCGSFLSSGGTNAAGILTPSDYPIRWLTNSTSGAPLGTYYVPANQSVEIQLEDIFNVDAESIVNSDDANLATIFISRSLGNHDPTGSKKEIYMTLNYDEQ